MESETGNAFHAFLTFPYRMVRWMMLTRPIRFTRFGFFYVLFTIGVGAAAINTGNNLIYLILGILLGFIVISGFLSDSGLWGLTTQWRPSGSLYAGEPVVFECRAFKGWFPGVAVTIASRWDLGGGTSDGPALVQAFAPWIPARSSVSLRVAVTPSRRGYLTLERVQYSTCFPFGLFQKSHTRPTQEKWIVYPRIDRLAADFLERQGPAASPHAASRQGLGSVPFVLRNYRLGDALRHVDWKTSAKRQRLIVKEMEEEANRGDLFILNAWPAGLTEREREHLISFIASVIFATYRKGRPFGLSAPERFFRPEHSRTHLHRIFEFLALVPPSDGRAGASRTGPLYSHEQTMDVVFLWKAYERA